MKVFRWLILIGFLLLIVAAVFRAPLFRFAFSYRTIGLRTSYLASDTALTHFVEAKAEGAKADSLRDIIGIALIATREQLDFNTGRSDNDPNLLIHSHRANCIGYAAFFSATCNHLLEQKHFDGQWVARPHIGQLYFFGHNVHKYFSDPFFYDHDFAVIENKKTGETLAVDPSMSDCLLIDYVTYVR